MVLYFSHLSPSGYVQSHTLEGAELEMQLDVVNTFVAVGYRPLIVYLLDEHGQRIDLPLEIFDGRPIGEEMRKLQKHVYELLRF